MLRIFPVILVVCAVLAATPACAKNTYAPPMTGEMAKLILYPNQPRLPDVKIVSEDKGFTALSDYRGRLIILNLWATWCPPCIRELPSLNALQASVDPNYIQVVTVSLDTKDPASIKEFLAEHNLDKLPGFMDVNGEIQHLEALNGAAGIPLTLIIDPQLRVLARYDGDADWNGADARAMIDYYRQNVLYTPF